MFSKKNIVLLFILSFIVIFLFIGCTMLPPTPKTYTITSSATEGGSISPLGETTVTEGASQSFTITPNEGYEISDVLVDGESTGVLTAYTFTDIKANHTISAVFAQENQPPAPSAPSNPSITKYTITVSISDGGRIDPPGSIQVNKGTSQTFNIIPLSPCYEIDDVLVDGLSEGSINSYTFANIQANHTIEVNFAPTGYPVYNINKDRGYSDISSAICEANENDTIIVCPGIYYENINIAKNITLSSVYPYDWDIVERTIINGDDDGTVVTFAAGGYEPTLTGFTIRNGIADNGGGIYMENSSPTVKYNIITDNYAEAYDGCGGGIYMYDNCDPHIIFNKIINNTARYRGGGIYMEYECDPTIENNDIDENEAEESDGGGIYMYNDSGDDTITANINHNYLRGNNAAGDGGGIVIYGNCNPIIESNIITDNESSGRGGGITIDDNSEPTIRDNDILRNYTGYVGGGISVYQSSPLIEYNTINDNEAQESGGGISVEWADSEFMIKNNTINNNKALGNEALSVTGQGGGIYVITNSIVTVSENDITNNTADEGGGIYIDNDCTASFIGNKISGNIAETEEGGGIYIEKTIAEITLNEITGNEAKEKGGGGIFLKQAKTDTTINNNEITDNISGDKGGGIHVNNSPGITIENNIAISGNWAVEDGGGIYVDEQTYLNPIADRPDGWGGIRDNIPTAALNDPIEGVSYTIAGNEFVDNVTGITPGSYTEGAHVYFD